MTGTAYWIVKLGQLVNQLNEATAKGFHENSRAMNLLSEIDDTVCRLQLEAADEFDGKEIING